ncbi:hypothetical protein ISCGN_000256 [Ixodes scapularis]
MCSLHFTLEDFCPGGVQTTRQQVLSDEMIFEINAIAALKATEASIETLPVHLLDHEREMHNRDLLAKDEEISRPQAEIQDLADVKVALYLEIANYVQKLQLLEAEESRLHITPSESVELTK